MCFSSRNLRLRCIVSMYGNVEEFIMYKTGKEKKMASLLLPIVRRVLKYEISNSIACIVVSRSLADIAKCYGSKRVWATYPNIDLSLFRGPGRAKQKKAFTVLFVGRREPEKGPLNVLEVVQMLTDLEFVVVGYGSLRNKMERIVKERKMTNVKLMS